ncbi:nucleotidyltransferase family protein [Patescibacteria group bacterium]|nr:nucleotidyltransferase family protein [Patescibacteria group bacterium]MBU3923049.1 nucleotidyltransferase family protein [Patescibacteria group bacterium]
MKVIILAGGKTNLPDKFKNIPKSLIEIDKRPVLDYQLELLKKNRFNDIRLVLFYKSDEILKYLKKKDKKADITKKIGKVAGIEYIVESKALGTGGAIRSAAKGMKKDFIVMNGDILTNFNISAFVKAYRNSISQPRFFTSSPFFQKATPKILPLEVSPLRKRVSHEDILGAMGVFYTQDTKDLGLIKTKNDRVVEFTEKPDYQYSGYINAGFYILSPKVFENKIYKSKKITEEFAIEQDIFPELAKNSQLLSFVHRGLWTDVGSEQGLKKAENIVSRLKEENPLTK